MSEPEPVVLTDGERERVWLALVTNNPNLDGVLTAAMHAVEPVVTTVKADAYEAGRAADRAAHEALRADIDSQVQGMEALLSALTYADGVPEDPMLQSAYWSGFAAAARSVARHLRAALAGAAPTPPQQEEPALCPTCSQPAEVPGEGRYCGSCQDHEGHCPDDHCMTCGAST